MNRPRRFFGLLALSALLPLGSASAADLRGSRASIRGQHEVAVEHDLTFLRTPAQIREYVEKERLEEVTSNRHLHVANVSFPYTRPAIRMFIERLAEQYFRATGDKLVVTSLTRPTSQQPRNASRWSVHPAGMALDLRIPASAKSRAWLESTLLSLEASDVLDVTRERRPPHYHVAVFPEPYESYVMPLIEQEVARAAAQAFETAAARMTDLARLAEARPGSMHAAIVGAGSAQIAALAAGALVLLAAGGATVRRARVRQASRGPGAQ